MHADDNWGLGMLLLPYQGHGCCPLCSLFTSNDQSKMLQTPFSAPSVMYIHTQEVTDM